MSFPALQAPPSTSFKCYSRKRSKIEEKGDGDQHVVVVGETPSVEFVSNEAETRKVAGLGSRCVMLILIGNKLTTA